MCDTALIFASKNNHTQCVQKLLQYGTKTNVRGNCGDTALMHAATKEYEETLQALLDNGANPNIINDTGCTALMFCTNNLNCTTMLIKAGANVNWKDKNGKTALNRAAGFGQANCAEKLNGGRS